jgi:hypothetical protein
MVKVVLSQNTNILGDIAEALRTQSPNSYIVDIHNLSYLLDNPSRYLKSTLIFNARDYLKPLYLSSNGPRLAYYLISQRHRLNLNVIIVAGSVLELDIRIRNSITNLQVWETGKDYSVLEYMDYQRDLLEKDRLRQEREKGRI